MQKIDSENTFLYQKIWGFSLETQQNPVFHKGK